MTEWLISIAGYTAVCIVGMWLARCRREITQERTRDE